MAHNPANFIPDRLWNKRLELRNGVTLRMNGKTRHIIRRLVSCAKFFGDTLELHVIENSRRVSRCMFGLRGFVKLDPHTQNFAPFDDGSRIYKKCQSALPLAQVYPISGKGRRGKKGARSSKHFDYPHVNPPIKIVSPLLGTISNVIRAASRLPHCRASDNVRFPPKADIGSGQDRAFGKPDSIVTQKHSQCRIWPAWLDAAISYCRTPPESSRVCVGQPRATANRNAR